MKILLTAGHGNVDSGSIGYDNGKEKDRTKELANLVAAKLKQAGHTVTVMEEKTYNGNWSIKNRTGYDYALSMHFNAFNGSATGTEVLYKNTLGKASELFKKVANVLGIKDRGAKKRTDLYMMNIGFDALIECCFHDNKGDLEAYNNKKNEVATIIAETINGGSITPKPNVSNSKVNVFYRVKTQAHGWLPEVKNLEDYAGYKNSAITGLAIKVDKGSIKYRVHVKGGSWLGWITKCDINDYHSGYAGNNKPIDAIQVYYYTPDNIRPYKKAVYKVNNYGWQHDTDTNNGQDGYGGLFGKNVTKFQISIK
jgi:hypothetical protein